MANDSEKKDVDLSGLLGPKDLFASANQPDTNAAVSFEYIDLSALNAKNLFTSNDTVALASTESVTLSNDFSQERREAVLRRFNHSGSRPS